MPRTLDQWLELGATELREIAERPRREAEILLGTLLGKDRLYLVTHLDEESEAEGFMELVYRRAKNEPIEYITSSVSFYSQEFYIAPGALIPRPETELLIEKLLQKLDRLTSQSFVEVGVGSGVVSIVLAQHLPNASFKATDISEDAIKIASVNIEQKDMQERIKLVHTDMLEGIDEKIDILVNNAGIWKGCPVEEISDGEWAEMLGINLSGTFHMIRACVPHMKRNGGGRIINVTSVHEDWPMPGNTAYCHKSIGL